MKDQLNVREFAMTEAGILVPERFSWKTRTTVEKFDDDFNFIEKIEVDGNLAVTAGVTLLWNLLIGAGGTVFSNANAHLGVGDSATAEAVGQTDLQAATNKLRKAMEATYPQVSGRDITFRSVFATGDANFAWNEWGIFNASSSGTMLNRKVESLGTKASGNWTLTVTLSFPSS